MFTLAWVADIDYMELRATEKTKMGTDMTRLLPYNNTAHSI